MAWSNMSDYKRIDCDVCQSVLTVRSSKEYAYHLHSQNCPLFAKNDSFAFSGSLEVLDIYPTQDEELDDGRQARNSLQIDASSTYLESDNNLPQSYVRSNRNEVLTENEDEYHQTTPKDCINSAIQLTNFTDNVPSHFMMAAASTSNTRPQECFSTADIVARAAAHICQPAVCIKSQASGVEEENGLDSENFECLDKVTKHKRAKSEEENRNVRNDSSTEWPENNENGRMRNERHGTHDDGNRKESLKEYEEEEVVTAEDESLVSDEDFGNLGKAKAGEPQNAEIKKKKTERRFFKDF